MTPDALRALADTVAWQDRTDLHAALLGAADTIERLEASNDLLVIALEATDETFRRAAERSRAVREDLDLAPRADWRVPVLGAEGREIEGET